MRKFKVENNKAVFFFGSKVSCGMHNLVQLIDDNDGNDDNSSGGGGDLMIMLFEEVQYNYNLPKSSE